MVSSASTAYRGLLQLVASAKNNRALSMPQFFFLLMKKDIYGWLKLSSGCKCRIDNYPFTSGR